MEMGTGKTKVAIDTICYLRQQGKISHALIVAPKGVVPVWGAEMHTHFWDDVSVQCGFWNTAKSDGGISRLYDPAQAKSLRILIINVEAISTRRGVLAAKEFLVQGPAIMVVDESTTIKTPGTNRSKGVIWLGKIARYRRILTGMPIEQSPIDLYGQCEFLRSGILGHRSYYSFRGAYSNLIPSSVRNRTVLKIVGYKDLGRLSDKLKEFSYRVTKEEVLDLPPKVYQVVEVELTEEQKKAYKDMRDASVAVLESFPDAQSSAVMAVTQILRLHQIVCGHLPLEDGTVADLASNRLNALLSLLEEVRGKAIIWASYRRDVKAIEKKLTEVYGSGSVVTYYGDTTPEDRAVSLFYFKTESNCRFFVGTAKTAGMGITLTEATTVVYYSNTHSVRDRVQSEDRAHRIGQYKSVTYIDLVCRKTVDEVILKALKEKRELGALVVNGKWRDLI